MPLLWTLLKAFHAAVVAAVTVMVMASEVVDVYTIVPVVPAVVVPSVVVICVVGVTVVGIVVVVVGFVVVTVVVSSPPSCRIALIHIMFNFKTSF